MVLSHSAVSAALVSCGDASEVAATLPFEDITVGSGPFVMYERYIAAESSRHDVIYTQDDDCIVDADALLAKYDGRVLCNMPEAKRREYAVIAPGVALVGWGSVFPRSALSVFEDYLAYWPEDELFYREADRIFTGLNALKYVDVSIRHLPKAHGSERLGAQSNHLASLATVCARINDVRHRLPRQK